ncbi:uroporphyrinogen decarboxylase [Blastococcus sp. Marseille-P5729]|uniref:uroporphyrinogen decarboxylase n=1 Tax=Blastococcus sp. Marseille-P5729 TaxID=2086582 RepID=UPI000D10674F|nr:uroporphyrinogen decarboxylase [Blastococcus sp. Marseille-P5729]
MTDNAASSSPLVAAARRESPPHTPVWFMRQAGRSLPEYRTVREGIAMLDSCMRPDLVAEITMQPVRRHGVDAAILFSDIVLPLKAIGMDLDIVAGVGPVIANPIASLTDVEAIPEMTPDAIGFIAEAIGLIIAELGETPLIGFAGAPFTLASYLIEGGPSRNHEKTKALMLSQPEVWDALLSRLAQISTVFLRTQIEAGASAVQLFDSWAGSLTKATYERHVLAHSARIFNAIGDVVPKIHFGVGTSLLLESMGAAGADVVGIDWRTPLDEATALLGPEYAVQGNLDPAVLFADWPVIEREVRRILAEGRAAPGHIFNLGHGVLPATDPDVITRVVELVHEVSAG